MGMKHLWLYAATAATAFAVSGCSSNDEAYVAALREAVGKADSSLRETVQASEASSLAIAGELSVQAEIFSVRGVESETLMRFRYALDGEAIGEDNIGSSNATGACSHAISASEAIAIAEADQNGTATGIELEIEDDDDDEPCTWEIQVLTSAN